MNIFGKIFGNNVDDCSFNNNTHTTVKNNQRITVNGNVVWESTDSKEKIQIGDIVIEFENFNNDINVCCYSEVKGGITTMSGNVLCDKDLIGSVNTQSGDVEVSGNIKGNVSTMSGDVTCNSCERISTMSGNIYN